VIQKTLPMIGTSNRANELVIDIAEAQSRRLDEELALERRLIEQGGLSVSEAQSRVAQEFANRPVFGEDIRQRVTGLPGSAGAGAGEIGSMSIDQLRATAQDDAALARMTPEQRSALASRLRTGR
jgi:hypothetical protein